VRKKKPLGGLAQVEPFVGQKPSQRRAFVPCLGNSGCLFGDRYHLLEASWGEKPVESRLEVLRLDFIKVVAVRTDMTTQGYPRHGRLETFESLLAGAATEQDESARHRRPKADDLGSLALLTHRLGGLVALSLFDWHAFGFLVHKRSPRCFSSGD